MTEYRVVLTAGTLRSLRNVPPKAAEPLVAFVFGSLAADPRRRGKALQRELAGLWAARRGDFRVIYRLDDEAKVMYVLKVAFGAQAHRPG